MWLLSSTQHPPQTRTVCNTDQPIPEDIKQRLRCAILPPYRSHWYNLKFSWTGLAGLSPIHCYYTMSSAAGEEELVDYEDEQVQLSETSNKSASTKDVKKYVHTHRYIYTTQPD